MDILLEKAKSCVFSCKLISVSSLEPIRSFSFRFLSVTVQRRKDRFFSPSLRMSALTARRSDATAGCPRSSDARQSTLYRCEHREVTWSTEGSVAEPAVSVNRQTIIPRASSLQPPLIPDQSTRFSIHHSAFATAPVSGLHADT